jgi:ribosomal protein S18 acetylase RimI-like enzyme
VSEWVIRPARREDKEWVKPLFERDRLLGRFGPPWWYYWSRYRDPEERWDVVDGGQGFVHYRARQDGLVSLYEMAVHPDYRRQGVGTALVNHLGRPIALKTDADNTVSNAFYTALGFTLMGQTYSQNGKKTLNVYMAW